MRLLPVILLVACSAGFSDEQLDLLAAMTPMTPVPEDSTNAVADDANAAELGRELFFSTALSESGNFSCASCHDPALEFADGERLSTAAGTTGRHAPSVINSAYNRWQFWDGRCDSQWCQALGPMEAPTEMAGTRLGVAHAIFDDAALKSSYELLFGAMPPLDDARFPAQGRPVADDPTHPHALAWSQLSAGDQANVTGVFVNVGKAIEAYERLLVTREGALDDYISGLLADDEGYRDALSPEAERGLELFVGDGLCHFCHTGPLLTNGEFHNVALGPRDWLSLGDNGRFDGITALRATEFNALGPYSDDTDGLAAQRLQFLALTVDAEGQFKVPGLRRVADSGPYMHGGHLEDLTSVVDFYAALDETPEFGHLDETLAPLELSEDDTKALVIFMEEALAAELVDPSVASAPE
jgi:cytochrome c peroxidase